SPAAPASAAGDAAGPAPASAADAAGPAPAPAARAADAASPTPRPGEAAGAASPAPARRAAGAAGLARTGPHAASGLTALAGAALGLGGLNLIIGARRRRSSPTT